MIELTDMERAIVELVARENWPEFQTDALRVLKRESTGVGRYTYLADGREQPLADGAYSARHRIVALPGVHNGLDFEIGVSDSRINYIELVTSGDVGWDGSEDGWKIV